MAWLNHMAWLKEERHRGPNHIHLIGKTVSLVMSMELG